MNWKPAAVLVLILGVGVGLYFAAPSLEKRWGLNPAAEEKPPSDTVALLHDVLNRDNVTQITVGEGADQFVLTRSKDDKNEWTLRGGWPTRDHETRRFVDSLTSLQSRFEADKFAGEEEPNLASYGLDKPVLIVQVTAKDKTYRLAFGQGKSSEDANRFSKPTYLRVDDRPEVIRLAPGLLAELTHPGKYYEQRRLFPAKREKSRTNASELENVVQAGAISITNRTKKEDLSYGVRYVDGEWQLDKPYRDRMDDAKFHPVLTALTDIWAEQFVDSFDKDQRLALTQMLVLNTDPLSRCFAIAGKWDSIKESLPSSRAEFGFEDPEGQAITLTTPDGKTIEVIIGKEAPAPVQKDESSSQGSPAEAEPGKYHYARLKKHNEDGKYYPVVFIIKYSEVQKNAFVDFQNLRDSSVRSFRPVDAILVEVERDKDKLVFEKNERGDGDPVGSRWRMKAYRHEGSAGGWQSHESLDSEVEAAKIDDLLLELSNLKAEKTDNKDDIVYQDDPKYGLDRAIRVHVRVDEEEKAAFEPGVKPERKKKDFTVLLAAKESESGKYYAKLDGFPRINRVRNTILPILQRPVADFQRRKLFDWAAKQLKTISVRLKDETVTLEQKESHWSLAAPVQANVDESKASNLADQLSGLQAVEFLKSDEPDAKYGFDAPTATVVATFTQDNAERTAKLLIGKQREDKPQYFARLEGRKDVLVIDKRFVDELSQGSLSYRPLKFDKLTLGGIREIRIQKHKDKELALAPQGAAWTIKAPFQAKAQTGLVQTIADALVGLKAERYIAHKAGAEELERYGLKDPQFRVTMVPEAVGSGSNPSNEAVLFIGKTEDKDKGTVYAKFTDDDAVFTIARESVAAIDVTPLALLNPRVLNLPPTASVVGFESHAGDKGLKLELKDNKWTVTESPAGSFTADPQVVDKLMITLRQLAVKEFKEYGSDIDWGKYDLKNPPLTAVVVTGKEASKSQQIAFGSPVPDSKGAYYARIGELPAIVVLDADTSATLRQGYLDFVNRQIFQDLKPDKVTKVQIQQGERSLVLEKKVAAWQIQASAPAAADDQTIEDVLHELATLRAKRVAAFPVKEWKDYSPDAPSAIVKLQGDKEIELQIGKVLDEATGNRAAMVAGSNTVFVMSGDVAHAFVAGPVYFRDHQVARIRDEVDRVILESGGKKTVFLKVDGTWKRKTEGDDAEADHDELEDFVNSLSKLRADELFAEKPADLKAYGLDAPAMRWRLQAGDKDVLVLDVGKTAPEKEKDGVKQMRHFARVDQGDLVFVLDEKATIRALGRFRVRRIFPDLTDDQIVSLKYQYGKETFSMTKAGRQWICSDAGVQVDPQRVEETLQGLANLKAERFVAEKATDLQPFGLKEPMLTIEIQTGKAKRKFELQISNMDVNTGKYYARVGGGTGAPDVFLISYQDSMRLVRRAEDFAKLPPPIPPGGDR